MYYREPIAADSQLGMLLIAFAWVLVEGGGVEPHQAFRLIDNHFHMGDGMYAEEEMLEAVKNGRPPEWMGFLLAAVKR